MKRLLRDPRFWICGLIISVVVLLAVFAPLLTTHIFDEMNPSYRLKGPGNGYLLGTDEFGRDIWTRMIYGARLTLLISFGSIMVSLSAGTLLGMNAGYRGKMVEMVTMSVIDFVMSFPPILVAMFIIVFIGSSVQNLILTIGIVFIPTFARVARSATLAIKQNEYVEAARAMGATDGRILRRTIIPNIWGLIIVQISLSLGNAMLLESSLSFLGLGPPPYIPSWGRSIADATRFMHINAHAVIWPSVILTLTILAFSILGDTIHDGFDPRLKSR